MTAEMPPAGWYLDPYTSSQLLYWDGWRWTEHTPAVAVESLPVASEVPGAVEPEELVTERERVYGNDMLYVRCPDGSKVGHLNLGTGEVVIDDPARTIEFEKVVQSWNR